MAAGEKPHRDNSLHHGHRQRMKARVRQEGLTGFADHEVLELLLFYAIPQRDTNELAHQLLRHFGSLSAVLSAPYEKLLDVPGVGPHAASLISIIPDLFRRFQKDRWDSRHAFHSLTELGQYATGLFVGEENECFYIICMDVHCRIIHTQRLAEGVVNDVQVYPRRLAEVALQHHAKIVALAHNHPGGLLRPSSADIELTKTVMSLMRQLDINFADHYIVCGDEFYSFAKKGMLFCD